MTTDTALRPSAPPSAEPIRIVLTHACPIIRAGLRALLACHPELAVAREGADTVPHAGGGADFERGALAVASADDTAFASTDTTACAADCDVIITDYARGIAAARTHGSSARILVLTTHDREGEVRHAVDSGVHGYLVQGCASEELVQAVRSLAAGRRYLGETIHQRFAASLNRPSLTPREIDVLQLLFTGAPDKLIARALGIGAGTVKCHVQHLLQKLDASARTQAVVVGIERGLIGARTHAAALPVAA